MSLGRTPGKQASLREAWRAFTRFAEIPVRQSELSDDPLSDGLLFDVGVGRAFQLSFVRQFATADGDLQQIELDVQVPATAFARLAHRITVRSCPQGQECPARCFFGSTALVGSPCSLSLARGGRTLQSASAWSFDTGGSGTDEQRKSWIAFVESSPVFREAATLRPLGYAVSQGSAE